MGIGTKVRVSGGIFDGVSGVITELRQQCKVIIALSAVPQCFSLEIGIEHVELGESIVRQSPFAASSTASLKLRSESMLEPAQR